MKNTQRDGYCRKCGSDNVSYSKWIHKSKIGGKDAYHYKLLCLNCNAYYCVQRTGYVYQQVLSQKWLKKGDKVPFRNANWRVKESESLGHRKVDSPNDAIPTAIGMFREFGL